MALPDWSASRNPCWVRQGRGTLGKSGLFIVKGQCPRFVFFQTYQIGWTFSFNRRLCARPLFLSWKAALCEGYRYCCMASLDFFFIRFCFASKEVSWTSHYPLRGLVRKDNLLRHVCTWAFGFLAFWSSYGTLLPLQHCIASIFRTGSGVLVGKDTFLLIWIVEIEIFQRMFVFRGLDSDLVNTKMSFWCCENKEGMLKQWRWYIFWVQRSRLPLLCSHIDRRLAHPDKHTHSRGLCSSHPLPCRTFGLPGFCGSIH